MKRSKIGAALIVAFCGGKLILALAIGGAGISALFGLEGALVATAVLALAVPLTMRRREPTG